MNMRVQVKISGKFRDFFRPQDFNVCEFFNKPGSSIMIKFINEVLKKSGRKFLQEPCPMFGEFKLTNATASETWLNIMMLGFYNHEVHLKFLNDNFTIKLNVLSEVYETSP